MRARVIMHTSEPYAGAAQYVSELVQGLATAKEDVVLFCPRNFAYLPAVSGAGAVIAPAGNRGTDHAGLAARVTRNLRFFVGTCLRQVRLTRSRDIVHFQFPLYFPAGLVLFLLAKLQARAIVYTAHDPVPHKWLLPPALRFIERRCLRCAYQLSDRIIVHNAAGKELLERVFLQKPSKISVIPHGTSALNPAEISPRNSGTLDLLLFGSIRQDKGIDLSIAAVRRVNASGLKVRLLIAGTVANARELTYWDDCRQAIGQAGDGITVQEGFIPDGDVAGLLAGCDAVLLPYRNFESESGVAAVAIAAGRPILATNTGGFATLLRSADLGIPIEAATAESVETAIRIALASGPGALREKGLRGLEFARADRSWPSVASRTADLYAELRIATARGSQE
jgi:glycogen synthase